MLDVTPFTPIIDKLQQELDVQVCSIYLSDEQNKMLTLVASDGLDASAIGAKLSFNQGLTGQVARTKKTVAIKKPHEHPDYHYIAGSGEEQYQSYLGIPLLHYEQLQGVLVVQTVRSKMFFMSDIKKLFEAGREVLRLLDGENNQKACLEKAG
jgi:phosphotransferase system enzyme I (PtsP)